MKRVELFNGNEQLQGIDYTYTINGALKSINHADPALDPGEDADDVFGETLEYFDNDYTGADYSAGTQTISGGTDRYNGLLKAMSWHSPAGNHDKQTYVYQYDDRDQLADATWGSMTGSAGAYGFSAGSAQAYREAVPGCDKNGNIQSLIRKGKDGRSLANFDYDYEANTNRLDKVNESSSVLIDYSYNAIGQLIRLEEGEDKDIEIRYNAYGLISEIRDKNDNDHILQSYHYDDRGNLLQKVYYSGGVAQLYTTYISDVSGNVLAIYVQETAELEDGPTEVPIYGAGRLVVYKPSVNAYFYEVSDHLGNVRAVIGVSETETYFADFETAANTDFENYSRYDGDEMDHTDPDDDVYTYSQLLNGGYAGRIGVARSFRVTPGDVLKVEAYGKYRNLTSNLVNLDGFAAALTSAFGLQSGLPGDPGMAYDALNSYGTAIAGGLEHHDDVLAPKAYVNILLFDKNFIFVDAAYAQLDGDAEQVGTTPKVPHDYLMREVTVTESGYAYIFVSNENLEQVDVHFDDVKITHTHSNVVAGADYYPFGLVMDGREIDDEPYRYGYQGQFSEEDEMTGYSEFDLRFYDAKIARWLTTDPYGQYYSPYVAMGNTPHMSVDPDGGWSSWASFGVGFAVGSVASAWIARENGASMKQAFLWGIAGGVTGGLIGFGLNNIGAFIPDLGGFTRLDVGLFPKGVSLGFRTVTVLISNGAGKGVGGKLGGHVAVGLNGVAYGFSNATTEKNGETNILGIEKDTWHAPGDFGTHRGAGRGDVRYDIPITDLQSLYILDEINSMILDPPNYGVLHTKCASAAARILRAGKVIPKSSKFHQESPYQFRRYLERKFKKYRVYGSERNRPVKRLFQKLFSERND